MGKVNTAFYLFSAQDAAEGAVGSNERHALKFPLALLLLVLACFACGCLRKHDISPNLISEMEKNCRKVVIKMDYDEGVYVITNTGKLSKERCPIAQIQGWKDGRLIEQKEVALCGCKDK